MCIDRFKNIPLYFTTHFNISFKVQEPDLWLLHLYYTTVIIILCRS